jgi:hypothetical protein
VVTRSSFYNENIVKSIFSNVKGAITIAFTAIITYIKKITFRANLIGLAIYIRLTRPAMILIVSKVFGWFF